MFAISGNDVALIDVSRMQGVVVGKLRLLRAELCVSSTGRLVPGSVVCWSVLWLKRSACEISRL